jgi:putative MATE family efflux protein
MKDMTQGSEARLIVLFALPMLIGNVFQQLYMVVDSLVVGRYLGKQALAAIGACFPIVFLLIALAMGLTMGASILISQYYGAKDFVRAKKAIDTTYISLFVVGVLLSITGPFLSQTILIQMHTPAEILPLAKIFIDIFFYGLTFMFGYNTVSSVLRAVGDSKTPTIYLILSTVVNSILVVVFVTVFHWGIAGSGVATLIAQGASFLGLILHVNRKENALLHFKITRMIFDWESFQKIVKLGLPAGVQQLSVALGMMAIIRFVNNFGTDVIAGFTAASRLDAFALMPSMNLSIAVSTFVGQNSGANKMDRVRQGLRAGLWLGVGFSILISALILLTGRNLLGLFTQDLAVIAAGLRYFHIAAWFYIVFSVMFVLSGLFRGAGNTLVPMILTILSMFLVRIPVARVLSRRIGPDGIWWSFVIGWGVGLILCVGYYYTGRWKRFSLITAASSSSARSPKNQRFERDLR